MISVFIFVFIHGMLAVLLKKLGIQNILMGNGIILMRMTLQGGKPEQSGAGGFDSVEIIFGLKFLWNSTTFSRGWIHPDITSCDQLILCGLGKQIYC